MKTMAIFGTSEGAIKLELSAALAQGPKPETSKPPTLIGPSCVCPSSTIIPNLVKSELVI